MKRSGSLAAWIRRAAIIILEAAMIMSLFGCIGGKKYNVDYNGSIDAFVNAKESYRAGETVRLKAYLATDTDYSMEVDGEYVSPSVSDNGAFIIFEFVMPDHDIEIRFNQHNSMVYVPEDTEGTLLFDYYTAQTAIVGEEIYNETTINKNDNGEYFLNTYSGSRTNGTTDSHTAYWATEEVLEEVMSVVEQYKMKEWNEQGGVGLEGAITVVKFLGEDGELIRVSTEKMPEDGKTPLNKIGAILSEYLSTAVPVE